jgi:hypothetical protein
LQTRSFSAPSSKVQFQPSGGLMVLMNELVAAGIVFTERGVEFRKWPAKPYVPTGIKQKMPHPAPPEKKSGSPKTIKNLHRAKTRD